VSIFSTVGHAIGDAAGDVGHFVGSIFHKPACAPRFTTDHAEVERRKAALGLIRTPRRAEAPHDER